MRSAIFELRFLAAIAAVLFTFAETPSQAADFQPEVRFVQVGEVKLAYYTRGEGRPLVMINGFVEARSPTADEIRQRVRLFESDAPPLSWVEGF